MMYRVVKVRRRQGGGGRRRQSQVPQGGGEAPDLVCSVRDRFDCCVPCYPLQFAAVQAKVGQFAR